MPRRNPGFHLQGRSGMPLLTEIFAYGIGMPRLLEVLNVRGLSSAVFQYGPARIDQSFPPCRRCPDVVRRFHTRAAAPVPPYQALRRLVILRL